jgi:hypothetical protein
MSPAAQRTRLHLLLTALLSCVLSAPGCLRFAYSARDKDDAGSDSRAGGGGRPSTNAGEGGAGSGGADAGDSGSGGSDQPSDAGSQLRDADPDPDEIPDAAPDDSDAGGVTVPADAAAADGGEPIELCPDRPELLFCDGFEDPVLSNKWDYNVVQNGTTSRTTSRKRTGVAALLATTGPPQQGTWARWATEVLAKQKSGHAWMRFYNWVPGTVDVTAHFSVGVMSESVLPYAGFELRLRPTHVDINSSSGVFAGTTQFPRDRWVCVELHVHIDPAVGVYEAYIDGVLAVTSGQLDTRPADGFTAAEIGVHYADPSQGPVQVYVDDVAVGTARIPCQ